MTYDVIVDNNEQPECEHPIKYWVHAFDPDQALGDSYRCGLCGELTQVG